VLEATLAAMEKLGADRERIVAAVGPCIGVAAYEVGWDFQQDFLERDPHSRQFFIRTQADAAARPHFDLAGYAAHRLRRAGPTTLQLTACTYAREDDFFSYRRSQARNQPDYGRQISAIVLT
jgi:polyphenol oxidase